MWRWSRRRWWLWQLLPDALMWSCPIEVRHIPIELFSISRCYVRRVPNSLPTGHFTCECGFTYCRSGPDRSNTDMYKASKILERGDLWKTSLHDLFQDPATSFNFAAAKLGVNKTKIKHLLSLYYPELLEIKMGRDFEVVRQAYRDQWLQIVTEFPEAKGTELARKVPQVYQWLYNNDARWLQEQKPSSNRKVFSPAKRQPLRPMRPAVNWQQRDKETAQLIRSIAEKLQMLPQRPKRITKGAICREGKLPFLLLKSSLENIPLTKQALDEVIETYLDFALRRIQWLVQQDFSQMGRRAHVE